MFVAGGFRARPEQSSPVQRHIDARIRRAALLKNVLHINTSPGFFGCRLSGENVGSPSSDDVPPLSPVPFGPFPSRHSAHPHRLPSPFEASPGVTESAEPSDEVRFMAPFATALAASPRHPSKAGSPQPSAAVALPSQGPLTSGAQETPSPGSTRLLVAPDAASPVVLSSPGSPRSSAGGCPCPPRDPLPHALPLRPAAGVPPLRLGAPSPIPARSATGTPNPSLMASEDDDQPLSLPLPASCLSPGRRHPLCAPSPLLYVSPSPPGPAERHPPTGQAGVQVVLSPRPRAAPGSPRPPRPASQAAPARRSASPTGAQPHVGRPASSCCWASLSSPALHALHLSTAPSPPPRGEGASCLVLSVGGGLPALWRLGRAAAPPADPSLLPLARQATRHPLGAASPLAASLLALPLAVPPASDPAAAAPPPGRSPPARPPVPDPPPLGAGIGALGPARPTRAPPSALEAAAQESGLPFPGAQTFRGPLRPRDPLRLPAGYGGPPANLRPGSPASSPAHIPPGLRTQVQAALAAQGLAGPADPGCPAEPLWVPPGAPAGAAAAGEPGPGGILVVSVPRSPRRPSGGVPPLAVTRSVALSFGVAPHTSASARAASSPRRAAFGALTPRLPLSARASLAQAHQATPRPADPPRDLIRPPARPSRAPAAPAPAAAVAQGDGGGGGQGANRRAAGRDPPRAAGMPQQPQQQPRSRGPPLGSRLDPSLGAALRASQQIRSPPGRRGPSETLRVVALALAR
ncbi:hypothetical protein PAPYR_7438 [Paratrimastix pyriformis]|uniref:Uncharacterized protein n=1 Tax=Paratrimastix pyriformis TaxID=342808 RepID=A0ABQ8UFK9_9EUKA|nr:hypothetical protein PAPYR_7438 [Paratrimastix pyriformis]